MQNAGRGGEFAWRMQAQDYLGTLWAIGLRLPSATEKEVERAIEHRTIIRTWPLRSTLHFVAAADVHWFLELLGPTIISTEKRIED
jgi:Winged helix DNA-binding domain